MANRGQTLPIVGAVNSYQYSDVWDASVSSLDAGYELTRSRGFVDLNLRLKPCNHRSQRYRTLSVTMLRRWYILGILVDTVPKFGRALSCSLWLLISIPSAAQT